MKSSVIHENYVEAQKKDAEEMIDLLKRIPNEEKEKVHGILIGFVLGSESRSVKSG